MTASWIGSPPSELMSLTTESTDSGARVTVAGEVDCSTAPRMGACIESLLEAAPAEVVVDLTGVTFLDSAGLHALVTANARARGRGVRLRVLVATRAVLRPIQVTGLQSVLGVEFVQSGAGTGVA